MTFDHKFKYNSDIHGSDDKVFSSIDKDGSYSWRITTIMNTLSRMYEIGILRVGSTFQNRSLLVANITTYLSDLGFETPAIRTSSDLMSATITYQGQKPYRSQLGVDHGIPEVVITTELIPLTEDELKSLGPTKDLLVVSKAKITSITVNLVFSDASKVTRYKRDPWGFQEGTI